jgi:hypothetical protein
VGKFFFSISHIFSLKKSQILLRNIKMVRHSGRTTDKPEDLASMSRNQLNTKKISADMVPETSRKSIVKKLHKTGASKTKKLKKRVYGVVLF